MAVLQFTNDYTEMRTLQDEYFRTRNQETLKQCKALERHWIRLTETFTYARANLYTPTLHPYSNESIDSL